MFDFTWRDLIPMTGFVMLLAVLVRLMIWLGGTIVDNWSEGLLWPIIAIVGLTLFVVGGLFAGWDKADQPGSWKE